MAYATKTKIMTLDDVRALSPMSVNVDDDKLLNSLLFCQDVYISKAVGEPLYNQLIDQIATPPISAANLILLNGNGYAFGGLRVCLAWYTYWKSLTYINYSVTKKGLNKKFDPNAETVDSGDFNIIRSDALTVAEGYERQIIDFLTVDSETTTPIYPLYKQAKDDREVSKPRVSSTGIVL